MRPGCAVITTVRSAAFAPRGTALGASAIEVAAIADAAAALGGTAIVALRYSGVDPRPRHRGERDGRDREGQKNDEQAFRHAAIRQQLAGA